MMQCFRPARAACPLALTAMLIALSACATTSNRTASNSSALVIGKQATIEGEIVSVDTNPWAYDGNAVVTVATASAGAVSVQFPARWNLCKAPAPGDLQALKPHDRVQIVGTVTAPDALVVCAEREHRLRKME